MSQEFWLGTILSGILFILGTAISIFGPDIRAYYLEWRKNRTLRGTSLKIAKLEHELAEHTRFSADPGVASAYFWSGLFLIITMMMLLGLAAVLAYQIHTPILKPLFAGLIGIMWLAIYAVSNALHNKANSLSHPNAHAERLTQRIARLRAKLGEGQA